LRWEVFRHCGVDHILVTFPEGKVTKKEKNTAIYGGVILPENVLISQ
jgi:hypothetical protein